MHVQQLQLGANCYCCNLLAGIYGMKLNELKSKITGLFALFSSKQAAVILHCPAFSGKVIKCVIHLYAVHILIMLLTSSHRCP